MFIATRARRAAFTLIELLIVIAIIAILALIAVPNFLEAQVRAKVSRTHADMRSLSVAIEAYGVDWGRPALGRTEIKKEECHPGAVTVPSGVDDLMYLNLIAQSRLTTPVSYMTTIPLDVFAEQGKKSQDGSDNNKALRDWLFYQYQRVAANTLNGDYIGGMFETAANFGITWYVSSTGPSRRYSATNDQGRSVARALARESTGGGANAQMGYPDMFYDATNGTMSFGYIVRSNLNNP